MQTHILPILLCALLAMILGSVWYSPLLFGKAWMRLIKVDPEAMKDPVQRKKMQQRMFPLYMLQLLLSLFQIWVLSFYIQGWTEASGVTNALWIWAAFVMPTIATSIMWGNDSRRDSLQKFFIQAGYQLVMFVVFGLILGIWN